MTAIRMCPVLHRDIRLCNLAQRLCVGGRHSDRVLDHSDVAGSAARGIHHGGEPCSRGDDRHNGVFGRLQFEPGAQGSRSHARSQPSGSAAAGALASPLWCRVGAVASRQRAAAVACLPRRTDCHDDAGTGRLASADQPGHDGPHGRHGHVDPDDRDRRAR